MSELLYFYEKVSPTTWAYLSSLLMIGLFFKFSRFWSMRNLDLVLLILLAPGLLFVHHGTELQRPDSSIATALKPQGGGPLLPPDAKDPTDVPLPVERDPPAPPRPDETSTETGAEPAVTPVAPGVPLAPATAPRAPEDSKIDDAMHSQVQRGRNIALFGFIWLFAVGGLFLLRLLIDPAMVRRPLLEPNLSVGGLTFLGCCLLLFLMANVCTGRITADELTAPRDASRLLDGATPEGAGPASLHGPGLSFLYVLPNVSTMPFVDGARAPDSVEARNIAQEVAVKIVVVLAHLFLVAGMILIGHWHFDSIKTGIGTATLYLMLPYTSLESGHAEHIVPAAFMVWAVAFYRRPLVAGILMGMAMGVVYYPLFLLPLWLSFYWERGVVRFVTGVGATLLVLVTIVYFTSATWDTFVDQFQKMFGLWWPKGEGLGGVWGLGWDPVYRIPVLAAFVVLASSLAIWPAQKNLGTLMSCSAGVMLASQFWHGFGGGTFMAWYLPLALLTIFRPNLEDRVALVVLGEGWFPRRREPVSAVDKAA